jgi:hypothetical protein
MLKYIFMKLQLIEVVYMLNKNNSYYYKKQYIYSLNQMELKLIKNTLHK